jgi:hypothetical protein
MPHFFGKNDECAFCRKPLRPVGNENPARDVTGENRDDFQRRRRNIFVETRTKRFSSSVRSDIFLKFGGASVLASRRRCAMTR